MKLDIYERAKGSPNKAHLLYIYNLLQLPMDGDAFMRFYTIERVKDRVVQTHTIDCQSTKRDGFYFPKSSVICPGNYQQLRLWQK